MSPVYSQHGKDNATARYCKKNFYHNRQIFVASANKS